MLIYLKEIIQLLKQINTITINQTTVLLSDSRVGNESIVLEMIEGMVAYKEQLITQVEEEEKSFEQLYERQKVKLTSPKQVEELQEKIKEILCLKEAIVEQEKKNLLIMQSRSNQPDKRMEIPKNASQVAQLYGKNQVTKDK